MDSAATLLDLHDLIQGTARFDRDHLFEFFAGRNDCRRSVAFGHTEDEYDAFDSCGAIALEYVFPLAKNMKLYY